MFRYQAICVASGAVLAYNIYFFVFAKNRHDAVALAETVVGGLVAGVVVSIFWICASLAKTPPDPAD